MNDNDVRKGLRLAPGETVVWEGAPLWRRLAGEAFYLRPIALYLIFLFALDAYQAWNKAIAPLKALVDTVPLAVLSAFVLGNLLGFAWLTGRTTRYILTDRRIILRYGIAFPATLSIPFSRIAATAVAIGRDHAGDIAVTLEAGNHMAFFKLWPHARPWHIRNPQPMLRSIASVCSGGKSADPRAAGL